MAKFVLAGRADCPHFAKAELLADYLQKNLPCFRVHKITQHPDDWEHWLQNTCEKNGWKHTRSPIVWRELLDRGGKGLLLGGFNEFTEHAQHYYFSTSDMMTELMLKIGEENLQTHLEIQEEEDKLRSLIKPLQVWITSASAPSCYSLIPLLASGEVFGKAKDISIHLLDSSDCEEVLRALIMEAEDLAFPLLRGVVMHTVSEEAFLHADAIIVLEDVQQQEDQSSKDCVRQVAAQCKEYGGLIERNANEGVKIIVAGSTFVNLKALIIVNHVPSVLKHNVIAVAMQLECEAKAQLAKKLNVNAAVVKDVIVWGNIGGINFLDLSQAKIHEYDSAIWGPPSYSRPLLNMICDSKWMKNDFLPGWASRKKHRAGMSAAHTIATMLRYWYQDSPPGEIVSLGVISEGQFGIPEGIIFSMPVKFQGGKWEVLSEVVIPDEMKFKFLEATSELIEEKEIALPSQQNCYPPTEQASDLLTQESGLPSQQSSDLPVQQDSTVPVPTEEENVQPAQQDSALPIQQEGALPTQQEGALPTQREGALPTQREGDLPTQREGGLPAQQEHVLPTLIENIIPTAQENDLSS